MLDYPAVLPCLLLMHSYITKRHNTVQCLFLLLLIPEICILSFIYLFEGRVTEGETDKQIHGRKGEGERKEGRWEGGKERE